MLFLCVRSWADTLYVDLNSTDPTPPYASWATAATNIQEAVDAAVAGDIVLVTNGVYAAGGRPWFDSGTNRVTLTNAITLQSVNGPAFTLIVGNQVPGTVSPAAGAVRCVGMGGGAVLSGFTLTNGQAGAGNYPDGGGVAEITSGSCTVSNCVLVNNLATNAAGGGAYRVQLFNCQLTGNYATYGGGACACTLVKCTIASNTAPLGRGVYGATPFGNSFLTNCIIIGNSNYSLGGGVYGCPTCNSLLVGNGNTNSTSGGASYGGVLINCTLAGNFSHTLGAADGSTLANSIIYYNNNGTYPDCYQCTLTNCCTPVLLPANANCISNSPMFVDMAAGNYRLEVGSPCIDAGTNIYAPGPVDLDGNPRIAGAAVDMGAYENQNINPVHFVSLNSTNPVSPFTNWPTAATNIQDAIDAAAAGDTVLVTNGVYNFGGRVTEGALTNRVAVTRPVTVQSVNGAAATIIEGYTVPGTLYGSNAVRCVYLTNGATLNGFTLTNGATQNYLVTFSSIDSVGGGVYCDSTNAFILNCVIVSNTAFASSASSEGTLSNCLAANNVGDSAIYGALVLNCTVTNNSGYGGLNTCTANGCVIADNTGQNGGGALYSVLNNCVLSNNTASAYGGGAYYSSLTNCILANNQAAWGGGAIGSTLVNCLVVSNAAASQVNQAGAASLGGGTWGGTANNCTIVGNVAKRPNSIYGGLQWQGGGAYSGTLNNCIVYGNSENPGYNNDSYYNYYPGTLNYCDTTPLPAGSGNITNDPALIAGGNYHLQATSPCINSGDNSYVATGVDLDGNPRISGGTVDIGAYEYLTPGSVLSYAWAQQYGLPTDGTADHLDLDGTGISDYQKSVAGLNPTNPLSVLAMLTPPANTDSGGLTVSWQSVSNRTYYLQRATNLNIQPAFSSIQSNLAGSLTGTNSYTDTNALGQGPYFYRVGVQ